MIMVSRQDRVFDNETPTAGYGILNLMASYTFVTNRVAHVLSLNVQNSTDKSYRNHLSFIKAIAPEMGRSVRLVYAMRF